MGTNGSSGFKEVVYGSRTAAVIGRSPVPVLAVPLLAEWKLPRKILLAVNKFNVPDKLLNPVITLAKYFSSSIQVTVFTDMDDDYVEDFQKNEARVADFRDSLRERYPDTDIHAVHLAGRHFRESLQGWIDKENIDMLVMLTHRRTLIGSIFNSSMTKKMSYHTNIPLLAIPDNN
jgi:nucleotide-binding universal stress UspA family protein